MFRPLSVFIGMRYTGAKRRNHFVSFISLTSMTGLALGVLVMILVLSVMNGFDHEMRTRVLGMVPHATIESPVPIDDWRSLAARAQVHPQVVAVAAFNIISTLVMVVTDKKGDIAILRTLGATPGQIMATFMVQGTVIGVIGTLIGGVLGILAALNIGSWIAALEKLLGHKFLSADVYFIDYLPSQLMGEDVVLVCGAALLLSFLATLYPAWRAARTQPAEALRYE